MYKEITSTCYLLHKEKFLLLFHKKHQKWLPPGGHLEKGETPAETAHREVAEETGLIIEFISQENIWIEETYAKSIHRPYAILLEQVPAMGKEPAHEHLDFIYIAKPLSGTLIEGKWFSLEEILKLKPHAEIFPDTQKTIQSLAKHQLLV